MNTISVYPLSWPPGFPRTPLAKREKSGMRSSLNGALANVRSSLTKFGKDSEIAVTGIVLSSNVTLGLDQPPDTGVAVWFHWDGQQRCIAVDRYLKPEENLQAIHHVIEARRTEVRHGTLHLVRASFTGFKALPAPAGSLWYEVLGIPEHSALNAINDAFIRLSKERHPDRGGTDEVFRTLKTAHETAKQLRGA